MVPAGTEPVSPTVAVPPGADETSAYEGECFVDRAELVDKRTPAVSSVDDPSAKYAITGTSTPLPCFGANKRRSPECASTNATQPSSGVERSTLKVVPSGSAVAPVRSTVMPSPGRTDRPSS